ncbi:MAG: universal stress protein [Desulfuromonas sp.]|uniref:universal stress protein n=1 Tax=Desulfuromonas sp. TaxID=892 RepID=UPI000CB88FA3|nr:universal stress protein [Desulfuromonas sp.]PLX82666.1 MAG: universal stress protein [Desulfuromonas sp.]
MQPKILVPVDLSETTEKTLQALIAQRERFPCRLTLLHVINTDNLTYKMIPDFQVAMIREHARKAGEQLLETHRALLAGAGMDVEGRLEFGSPREVIPRIANDEPYQLLVIGRKRTGEIRDVLFGSVSNHVLHHVSCPVLLI